jgi:uncharacterized protein (DUF1499 family)
MNDTVRAAAWWAKAILIGAIIAAVLLPIGALGTRLGIWPFQIGLLLLVSGAALALLTVVLGIIALLVVMRQRRVAERGVLYIGLIIAGVTAGFMGMQIGAARSVPMIHNISTDVVDPPQFDAVIALRGPAANPLDYDSATLAPLQTAAYPGVKPLITKLDAAAAIDRTLEVLDDMGLEIVNVDREAGRVEATATSFWFGFKDDVVVRVRQTPEGSVIDLRSVSRVGRGDVGVNAKRIEEFIARFNAA